MFFKPKNRNYRVKPQREETWLEVAIGGITLAIMGYIMTVMVFSL